MRPALIRPEQLFLVFTYLDCQDQGRMAAVSTSVYEFDSEGTGHHIYKTVWIIATH